MGRWNTLGKRHHSKRDDSSSPACISPTAKGELSRVAPPLPRVGVGEPLWRHGMDATLARFS
jgi:hypothetical protein